MGGFTRALVLSALIGFSSNGAVAPNVETQVPERPLISWGPALAYTPTYGILVGGSLFRVSRSRPGIDFSGYLISSLAPNFQSDMALRYHAHDRLSFLAEGFASTFFTPYYGEGDSTQISNRVDLATLYLSLRMGPEFQVSPHWSIYPHLDTRARDEQTNEALIADQSTVAVGVTARYRTRDDVWLALKQSHQLTLRGAPQGFLQAEADLRFFYNPFEKITLATRVLGIASVGSPNYLFRSALGGNRMLRGFYENRFRGKHLAVIQEEVRYPIWDRLSGVLFLDAGDVSDATLRKLKWTYGAGLRFALPPDNVAKVRLDLGVSEDQMGVFFMFGDTF